MDAAKSEQDRSQAETPRLTIAMDGERRDRASTGTGAVGWQTCGRSNWPHSQAQLLHRLRRARRSHDWRNRNAGCSRWRYPRYVGEVEEIQQIRLRGIAIRKVRRWPNETVLDELDDRGVIHRYVRDVVPPRER
jgi:hypothetical protein